MAYSELTTYIPGCSTLKSKKFCKAWHYPKLHCFCSLLESHQGYALTRLQTFSQWGCLLSSLLSPILSLDCHFRLKVPAQFSNCITSFSTEQVTQNLHTVFLFITLRKLQVFQLWNVHTMRHATAQNSFLSCAVWIYFRTYITWCSNRISDKVNYSVTLFQFCESQNSAILHRIQN